MMATKMEYEELKAICQERLGGVSKGQKEHARRIYEDLTSSQYRRLPKYVERVLENFWNP